MTDKNKIAIITDNDFALMHKPPFPKPSFIAFENPKRVSFILRELTKKRIFDKKEITQIEPLNISDTELSIAHSSYHVESIKKISEIGGGIIAEEVFITSDTYNLAKKAVGGAISALQSVLQGKFNQSFAIIRPPGHHALRESASGLCIFNNIAMAILYMRKKLNFEGKIAIVDIDNHYGDGLARYFYEDPLVLYFSIHEFDYVNGDLGLMNELGEGNAKGTNINFPIPSGINNSEFMLMFELLEPILQEFQPDLIITAAGFDMYFADPIGNCQLTSKAYYDFTNRLNMISEELCDQKLVFVLEGGYSLIGLPYCVLSMIYALIKEEYQVPEFEELERIQKIRPEVTKIKNALVKLLAPYWKNLEVV